MLHVLRTRPLASALLVSSAALFVGCGNDEKSPSSKTRPTFTSPTQITNEYFPASKFRRCIFEGSSSGQKTRNVRLLLPRTKTFVIDGQSVETAVIEDKAYKGGLLVEKTYDYIAQGDDGVVYYLGEDVNNYSNGKVKDHNGSWLYNRDTKNLGVLMPAKPELDDTFRPEDVPDITIESDKVIAVTPTKKIANRTYKNVLKVREHLVKENEIEHKLFAPGYGIVQELDPDGQQVLKSCTK